MGYYIDKREVHHHNWHEVNSSLFKDRLYTVSIVSNVWELDVVLLRFYNFILVVRHSGSKILAERKKIFRILDLKA